MNNLLTVAAVAAQLGVKTDTVRKWITRYRCLPARKVGRDWLVDPADLARMVRPHGKRGPKPTQQNTPEPT